MGFAVMNVVRGTAAEVAAIVVQIQAVGSDAMRAHSGFRGSRLYVAEDGDEAVMIVEWDSREHFIGYRQSDAGRQAVETAMQWRPKISFYEVSSMVDPAAPR